MDARTVLEMATIGGAKAIGWEKEIGSLEPGKDADILIIDTDNPRLVPLYDATSHVVYAVNGSDVRDVIVAGRILVENRQLQTLDLKTILENARRIGKTIKNSR
jgi:5-methylthioadenosine/S-adenosylhomocysteine deaminase